MGNAVIYKASKPVASGAAAGKDHAYYFFDPDTDNDANPLTGVDMRIISAFPEQNFGMGNISIEVTYAIQATDWFPSGVTPLDRGFRIINDGPDAALKWFDAEYYTTSLGTYDALTDRYISDIDYGWLGPNSNSINNTIDSIWGINFAENTPYIPGSTSWGQLTKEYPGYKYVIDNGLNTQFHIYGVGSTFLDSSGSDTIRIDLSDLLGNYDPLTDAITDFVRISESSGNANVFVDRDGLGTTHSLDAIAVLSGITGLPDEVALVTNGNLFVG